MTLSTFFRGSADDLWVGLEASEALGIMGGVSLVSDYFGVAGQVTLHHVSSGARVPVAMASWGSSKTSLGGWVPMALLLDGEIRIEGRVVDLFGNMATLDLGFILAAGPIVLDGGLSLPVAASILATLHPGFLIGFPPASDGVVSFPPVSNSVRF